MNFTKFLRTPCLQNTSGRMLLHFKSTVQIKHSMSYDMNSIVRATKPCMTLHLCKGRGNSFQNDVLCTEFCQCAATVAICKYILLIGNHIF